MENEKVLIKNSDGTTMEVDLVTYLVSEDSTRSYLVYSKGEKSGAQGDEVIYISRVASNDGVYVLEGIEDDDEWQKVQQLLKKIANK